MLNKNTRKEFSLTSKLVNSLIIQRINKYLSNHKDIQSYSLLKTKYGTFYGSNIDDHQAAIEVMSRIMNYNNQQTKRPLMSYTVAELISENMKITTGRLLWGEDVEYEIIALAILYLGFLESILKNDENFEKVIDILCDSAEFSMIFGERNFEREELINLPNFNSIVASAIVSVVYSNSILVSYLKCSYQNYFVINNNIECKDLKNLNKTLLKYFNLIIDYFLKEIKNNQSLGYIVRNKYENDINNYRDKLIDEEIISHGLVTSYKFEQYHALLDNALELIKQLVKVETQYVKKIVSISKEFNPDFALFNGTVDELLTFISDYIEIDEREIRKNFK
ncbi:hypothetical protein [Streptococcus anginosus]|uniref:hypothetical protein n=1 Tax=Streptococcus anginosus TaxID=1328 RepID=UPI000D086771|nr:hypothetical protein [Streptococcus anginosus]PRT78653.1 hypothetical protein C6A31_03705 [Streptococcus anginosus]HBJ54061.1 hypothetical protein [Streptococcus sp.]